MLFYILHCNIIGKVLCVTNMVRWHVIIQMKIYEPRCTECIWMCCQSLGVIWSTLNWINCFHRDINHHCRSEHWMTILSWYFQIMLIMYSTHAISLNNWCQQILFVLFRFISCSCCTDPLTTGLCIHVSVHISWPHLWICCINLLFIYALLSLYVVSLLELCICYTANNKH